MNQIESYVIPIPAVSRARAYRQLSQLMTDLPAPLRVSFSVEYGTNLTVELASVADFDSWADRLRATVWQHSEVVGGHVQCRAQSMPWNGWNLFLNACIPTARTVAAAALTPDSPALPDGPHAIADEPDCKPCYTCDGAGLLAVPAADTISAERVEETGGHPGWRVAEILTALNAHDGSSFRGVIPDLPEFRKHSDRWDQGFVVSFELTDGTEISRTRRPLGPWAVSKR